MTFNVFNTASFLQTAGYLGLFLIVFAETSVLIGFFLPGDSLLFTAGLLSAVGYFNIYAVIVLAFAAAIFGDNVGYAVGRRFGKRIFVRQNSLLLDQGYIQKAEDFYRRHGGKTVIIGRFLPVVRTAAPILAGVGKMRYRTFLLFNITGSLLWTGSMSLLGFYLGKIIPHADRYLIYLIIGIVLISVAPTAYALLRNREKRKKIAEFLRSRFFRFRSAK